MTVQRWMQVVGKISLALAVPQNHWWQVALQLTASGMTTGPLPYDGFRTLQLDFDFIQHQLHITVSTGQVAVIPLRPMPVAEFYSRVMASLDQLSCPVVIWAQPVEVSDVTPLNQDVRHAAYDAEAMQRFWRVLLQIMPVFQQFRAGFVGKSSPVQFFWGGFDLAMSRFSGRPAPRHGPVPHVADAIVQVAYSHEVSSCGFWPGSEVLPEPAFFAYTYPAPEGLAQAPVQPDAAFYHEGLGEHLLRYADLRKEPHPEEALLAFLTSTYQAGAQLAGWDRAQLEANSILPSASSG